MSKRQWFAAITILAFVANPALGIGMLALALIVLAVLAILVGIGSLFSSNY